jgi:hypothetical protein
MLSILSYFIYLYVLTFQLQQREKHNHKPVFSNCSRYAPVINEEEMPGTRVIQVHAEDRDPPEEGGNEAIFLFYCFYGYFDRDNCE